MFFEKCMGGVQHFFKFLLNIFEAFFNVFGNIKNCVELHLKASMYGIL